MDEKITKKCMEMRTNPDFCPDLTAFSYISSNFFSFLNISVKTTLFNTKLGDLGNLAVLFLTMGINSC